MLECAVILLVGLVGGAVPLFVRWTDRWLHGALALSTGIFLGAVFLHMLPTLPGIGPSETSETPGDAEPTHAEPTHAAGTEHPAHADGPEPRAVRSAANAVHAHTGFALATWLCVLAGVLGVYLIETLVLGARHGRGGQHAHGPGEADDAHQHLAVGYAALVGLSLHSLASGMGLSAAARLDAAGPMFLAVLSHKGFEAFSLATVFQLAGAKRAAILGMIVLFSLVTPLGYLMGELLLSRIGAPGMALMTALAAGTFLYVCLCELLPEVFHHREEGPRNVAWLTLGVALMAVVATLET